MKKLTMLLILLTLSACCDKQVACPPYPPMPEEVKQALRDKSSPEILKWANDQVRLKHKLEVCRGK